VKFNNKSSVQVIIRDISDDIRVQERMESYKMALVKSGLPFVISKPDLTIVESCFDNDLVLHSPGGDTDYRKIDMQMSDEDRKKLTSNHENHIRVKISVDDQDKGDFSVLKMLDYNGSVSQLVFIPE
jgi:hypothetical protein